MNIFRNVVGKEYMVTGLSYLKSKIKNFLDTVIYS